MAKRPSKSSQPAAGETTRSDQQVVTEPASSTGTPPEGAGSHISEAGSAAGAAPATEGAASGPAAPIPSVLDAAEGTNSADAPPKSDDQGGSGNEAAPASAGHTAALNFDNGKLLLDMARIGDAATEKASEILAAMSPADERDELMSEEFLAKTRDDMRAEFPNFAAAMEAYVTAHESPPSGLRITCPVDGFRRAGIAHLKGTAEYPFDHFPELHQVEQLLAEPKLVVVLI